MDKREQAKNDYIAGMMYKDIATKYHVPINTLKSWRRRGGWKRDAKLHPKLEKVAEQAASELEANDSLTDKQKLFCLYYLNCLNATKAYQEAYKVSYDLAMYSGSRLLRNVKVKHQLSKLREAQSSTIFIDAHDVVAELTKQAFANLGDYLEFGSREVVTITKQGKPVIDPETGQPMRHYENTVRLKDSKQFDTSLIKGVRVDDGEIVLELYDKQKALGTLLKYLDYNDSGDASQGITIIDDV